MRRIPALLVALLSAVAACGDDGDPGPAGATTTAPTGDGATVSTIAPDEATTVELETFDGGTITLADYAGRPVVVNFFASWCAPCVTEMPEFERVNQAAAGEVAFVGIDVQDRVEDGRALVEETGVTWDIARDPDSLLVRAVGGVGMPTTVLISPAGEIVERHTGELSAEELVDLIAEHFGVEVEL